MPGHSNEPPRSSGSHAKHIVAADIILSGIISEFSHAAPISKNKPWQQPCVGSKPVGNNFVTSIDVNLSDVIQRLTKKVKMFTQKVDQTFLYLNDDLLSDPDLTNALHSQPRLEGFPGDCILPKITSDNQENYVKISKLYIFVEYFQQLEIDSTLRVFSDSLLASLNDILCEFSFLVDITAYNPIISLDRDIIKEHYNSMTVTEIYGWAYILLRDSKTFARSMLNVL